MGYGTEDSRPSMSDGDVLAVVRKARAARKAAITRAHRAYNAEANRALEFYGSSDVEQAARLNVCQRADGARWSAVAKADETFHAAMDALRARAGLWADLVPEVP